MIIKTKCSSILGICVMLQVFFIGQSYASSDEILHEAYTLGMTHYTALSDFGWNQYTSRQEFAKFLDVLTEKMGGYTLLESAGCDFEDEVLADPSLVTHVKNLCKKGLMKGDGGKFGYKEVISFEEVIAILVRASVAYDQSIHMIEQEHTSNPWYLPYISPAVKIGILEPGTMFLGPASRGEVIKMMIDWQQRISKDTDLDASKIAVITKLDSARISQDTMNLSMHMNILLKGMFD